MIGPMPETVEDRSLIIAMRKRDQAVSIAPFHEEEHGGELAILGAKAARWAAAKGCSKSLVVRYRALSVEQCLQNDRAWDNWSPLCAIAQRAGGRA